MGNEVELLLLSIISFPLCLLTLFVLVYYVLRRYKLYREIKRFPQELFLKESYRNHLKNLRLKSIIHNFVIIILVLEFLRNIGYLLSSLPSWFIYFGKETSGMIDYQHNVEKFSDEYFVSKSYTFVPVLCLFMNFLWLAYRKFEYRYTIIRWTWYIVLRIIIGTSYYLIAQILPNYYQYLIKIFCGLFAEIFTILDFIQYVYYSRRFYLLLKSRETEIRLFYFDKKAYLDIKYLCFHFKITTILVAIALFFLTVWLSVNAFDLPIVIISLLQYNYCSTTLHQWFCKNVYSIHSFIRIFILYPSRYVYLIIFNFNYLYMFIVVVHKSCRDRQKLANINSYIKPIVEQYHDRLHYRYANYTLC